LRRLFEHRANLVDLEIAANHLQIDSGPIRERRVVDDQVACDAQNLIIVLEIILGLVVALRPSDRAVSFDRDWGSRSWR
jgi:hypothetical protein